MATLMEAFDAAVAGKTVSHSDCVAVLNEVGRLKWSDSDSMVPMCEDTMEDWAIQEPLTPEYVDYPVVVAPTPYVEMPNNRHDLDFIWTQAGFAGYVFVMTNGVKEISAHPFGVANKNKGYYYGAVHDDDYGGIVWCDFVRFAERSQ